MIHKHFICIIIRKLNTKSNFQRETKTISTETIAVVALSLSLHNVGVIIKILKLIGAML